MRTAFFWAITQRVVIISYRRFGRTYPSIEDQRSSPLRRPCVVWGSRAAAHQSRRRLLCSRKITTIPKKHDVRITKFKFTLSCCLRGSQVIYSRRMYKTAGCIPSVITVMEREQVKYQYNHRWQKRNDTAHHQYVNQAIWRFEEPCSISRVV